MSEAKKRPPENDWSPNQKSREAKKRPPEECFNPIPKGRLAQCVQCGHIGLDTHNCKQCEDERMHVLEFAPVSYGVCCMEYVVCPECKYAEKLDEEQEEKDCVKCMQSGKKSKLMNVYVEKLQEQKFLPRCAQLPFNKCVECFDTAKYYERHLPKLLLMTSTVLRLTRNYEFLVEFGYKVNFNKEQLVKSKLLFEPTSLDVTPTKLRSLIEHHHKFCFCSICKFWIIADLKQDEL